MNTYAVYLHPRGPLASALSSDTLFGAICWGIEVLFGDVGLLFRVPQTPPFACSAPFPAHVHPKQTVRFYPRPATFDVSQSDIQKVVENQVTARKARKEALLAAVSAAKKLRKASFVSEKLFTEIANGRLSPYQMLLQWTGATPNTISSTGSLLVSAEELKNWPQDTQGLPLPIFATEDVQHNQIDRMTGGTGEGLLFYQPETFFSRWGGLWALLRADATLVESRIRPALRYLSDTGLGANRMTGKGQFEIKLTDAPALPDASGRANAFVSLSRYLPNTGEWSPEGPLAYQITTLWPKREQKYPRMEAGQSTTPVYKRRIRVFEPGAVFAIKERREIYGRLAEVVPESSGNPAVFQSGASLPVFIHISKENEV